MAFDCYDMVAKQAINYALNCARDGKSQANPDHILIGMCSFDNPVRRLLRQYDITMAYIRRALMVGANPYHKSNRAYTEELESVFLFAERFGKEFNKGMVTLTHLFTAVLLFLKGNAKAVLEKQCFDAEGTAKAVYQKLQSRDATSWESMLELVACTSAKWHDEPAAVEKTPECPVVRDAINIPYCQDITHSAQSYKLKRLVGREKEISSLVEILIRRDKNSAVLVGEPGVGKTAIVEGLAAAIACGDVPNAMHNISMLSLDLTAMLAGTKYAGEFEDRVNKLLGSLRDYPNVVLFIDEIHSICTHSTYDIAGMLKPALARGELTIIGATTPIEYKESFEKDKALERRFERLNIEPPSIEQATEILRGLAPSYEKHHGVRIVDEAILAAISLSERYIAERSLPDKAIDIIDVACSRKALQSAGDAVVDEGDVLQIIAERTGIPVARVNDTESERLLSLEAILSRRVVGQDRAVRAVASALRRARAGLKDEGKPIGSYLFMGPTGVGKTELCKALAEVMFGGEDQMIRLDMSEYMEKENVSRLIGSAPGYVGYEEGGQLTEQVRQKPYSVVLFDEIEKAHPDIFNILLQVMDDGRLTDSHGKTVSFKNCIIILTSNAGADTCANGTNEEQMAALRRHFRPEFINRLDEVVPFMPLSTDNLGKIVDKLLVSLATKLNNRGIMLRVSLHAKERIIAEANCMEYGARPLLRVVRNLLEDPISEGILRGTFAGGQTIWADDVDGRIVLTNERPY